MLYTDALVRTERGWRFRSRRCEFIGADGPVDRPPPLPSRRTADEAAILRTLTDYCIECDDARFDVLAECFTEDAVLVMPDEEVHGRAAIAQWFAAAEGRPEQRGKHLTTNVRYDIAGEHATVVADFAWLKFTLRGPGVPGDDRPLRRRVGAERRPLAVPAPRDPVVAEPVGLSPVQPSEVTGGPVSAGKVREGLRTRPQRSAGWCAEPPPRPTRSRGVGVRRDTSTPGAGATGVSSRSR